MLSLRSVAAAAIHSNFHPKGRDGAIAILDIIAAREATEREFELARLLRTARMNRHAETED